MAMFFCIGPSWTGRRVNSADLLIFIIIEFTTDLDEPSEIQKFNKKFDQNGENKLVITIFRN